VRDEQRDARKGSGEQERQVQETNEKKLLDINSLNSKVQLQTEIMMMMSKDDEQERKEKRKRGIR